MQLILLLKTIWSSFCIGSSSAYIFFTLHLAESSVCSLSSLSINLWKNGPTWSMRKDAEWFTRTRRERKREMRRHGHKNIFISFPHWTAVPFQLLCSAAPHSGLPPFSTSKLPISPRGRLYQNVLSGTNDNTLKSISISDKKFHKVPQITTVRECVLCAPLFSVSYL